MSGPVIVYPEPLPVEIIRQHAAAAAHCADMQWTEGIAITFLQLASLSLFVGGFVLLVKAASQADQRRYYWPVVLACVIGGCAYFAMSEDQGWVISHGCRQTFYSHFINMGVGLPLIILSLGFLAEAAVVDIAAAMGYTALMSASLLFGALSFAAFSRWIWFFFAVFWLAATCHLILNTFVPYMADGASSVSRLAHLIVICLILYPFLWIFTEGFHIFSISLEVFTYGLVDVTIRAVFGVLLMMASYQQRYSGSAYSNSA